MKRIPFNFDWTRIDGRVRFFGTSGATTKVNLPDDFCINKERDPSTPGGASVGFIPGGEATYLKNFVMPEEWKEKTVFLDIDGAYMNAEVSLNGNLLFHHPYGYTAFHVDLTNTLYTNEFLNKLSIVTSSIQPNSRWYAGGGLFREVHVLLGGKTYIAPWDIFITTPQVRAEKATVRIAGEVQNVQAACTAQVTLTAVDATGTVCGTTTLDVTLPEQGSAGFTTEFTVDSPKLWDVDDPNLYTLQTTVTVNGTVEDTSSQTFGIREIAIDFDNGFRLNGKPMKLRGGCIHHDNTLLGACAFPRAEERKIRILKDAGYNAIRCAHNPPSTAMLDVCDRLGMLVLDETFDMWNMPKNALDYHLYFKSWWQFDTESMVKRDRNHPSVYCWSIGNEIPEMTGKSDGHTWAKKQADFVRSLDPTRPVTMAINGRTDLPPEWEGKVESPFGGDRRKRMMQMDNGHPSDGHVNGVDLWGQQTEKGCDALDIVGYNYLWARYADDRVKYPKRIIHATETHSYTIYEYWKAVEANSNVIGDFIWTAYDNLGEAGAGRVIWDLNEPMTGLIGQYPWLSCYQGDMDLDGNRRAQSYYRKILWGLDKGIHLFTTDPDHTGVPFYGMGWHWADVHKSWTFAAKDIGRPVQLEAYGDCDEVAFIVNGVEKGRSKVEKLKAFLTVEYAPGTVEAVALREGKEITRTALCTSGAPAKIALIPERDEICADGMDIGFIRVEIQDAQGRVVPNCDFTLNATVCGQGELAGFGSGNPKTTESYGTGRRVSFHGKALAAIRSTCVAGSVSLTVTTPGLPAATVEIVAK